MEAKHYKNQRQLDFGHNTKSGYKLPIYVETELIRSLQREFQRIINVQE